MLGHSRFLLSVWMIPVLENSFSRCSDATPKKKKKKEKKWKKINKKNVQ